MIRLDHWLTLTAGERLRAAELVRLGRKWGVSGAASICQEVTASVAQFAEIAAGYTVPESDIHRFAHDIARRCRSER